jgi:hypothetical protein
MRITLHGPGRRSQIRTIVSAGFVLTVMAIAIPPTGAHAICKDAPCGPAEVTPIVGPPNVQVSTFTVAPVCGFDICTVTSTDDIPRFRVTASHLNVGSATVELRRSDTNAIRRSWTVRAVPLPLNAGGRLDLSTDVYDCQRAVDSYFTVRDPSSGLWSAPAYVSSICFVL